MEQSMHEQEYAQRYNNKNRLPVSSIITYLDCNEVNLLSNPISNFLVIQEWCDLIFDGNRNCWSISYHNYGPRNWSQYYEILLYDDTPVDISAVVVLGLLKWGKDEQN